MLFKPALFFDADTGGNNGGGGGEGKKEEAPKGQTFTQEQLDILFAERAKRASDATTADLLKKAGVASIEDLLAGYAKAKKLEEGQMSELQKAQAELAAEKEKALQAEKDKVTALATASERLMRAEVQAQAHAQNFLPDAISDVWLVIDKSKIKEENGVFVGVKEAVEAVAKAKPHWLEAGNNKRPAQGTPKPGEKKPGSNNGAPEQPQISSGSLYKL